MEQRKATGKATGRRRYVGNGRPKLGNEQYELAQTLPSRERLRVGEHSSGIRDRLSQMKEIKEMIKSHRNQIFKSHTDSTDYTDYLSPTEPMKRSHYSPINQSAQGDGPGLIGAALWGAFT